MVLGHFHYRTIRQRDLHRFAEHLIVAVTVPGPAFVVLVAIAGGGFTGVTFVARAT